MDNDETMLHVHYLAVISIAFALFFSFIIMVYAIRNNRLKQLNSWQFPMLLALLFDATLAI
jgi:hypothetical protein